VLQEAFVEKMFKKMAEDLLVGEIGLDASVLEVFERIPERMRYIYRTIGIEEEYWPQYLRAA